MIMENVTILFGTRIRELRKARGMTQGQLADLLDIEQKHVSLIELGKSYPSLDRLMLIAEALNVPLPSLFDFDHHMAESERVRGIEEMVRQLGEADQRRIYRIVKAFLEG
ncbi:helix-turn-helix transcriptional regulator [Geobacter sp. FeAm09]|nr:helix-turn-helix transcriptional regulator [Geobacter sp. FeAm09]